MISTSLIIIVGIAVGAMTTVITTNVASSSEPVIRQKTLKIANLYMDEIMGKRWDENTPASGGCITTAGSIYCATYCATLPFPNCGTCTAGAGVCEPSASIAAMGNNEELNRNEFDDIDDYNSATLSTTPSFPDAAGTNGETALDSVDGYTVDVTISEAALGTVPASDAREVVVSVTNPLGDTMTLTRYRINF